VKLEEEVAHVAAGEDAIHDPEWLGVQVYPYSTYGGMAP